MLFTSVFQSNPAYIKWIYLKHNKLRFVPQSFTRMPYYMKYSFNYPILSSVFCTSIIKSNIYLFSSDIINAYLYICR